MESGAQPGNDNAAKGAEWKQAIKRALAHKSNSNYRAGLDLVATEFIAAACAGDQWAVKEIGDRMDGKPAQSVTVAGDADNPLFPTDVNVNAVTPKKDNA